MQDTMMTIVGNVVDTPKLRRTKNGHFVANFRVASTPRRFERDKGVWVDQDTLFVTITCWRALGENVAASLTKGTPVLVTGRYCQREYEKDEQLRTAYELEAVAVGPDLSRGVAAFEKVVRTGAAPLETDEQGRPADQSDDFLDLAHDDEFDGGLDDGLDAQSPHPHLEVDPGTGEVRELVRG